jgi:hypothetical protein
VAPYLISLGRNGIVELSDGTRWCTSAPASIDRLGWVIRRQVTVNKCDDVDAMFTHRLVQAGSAVALRGKVDRRWFRVSALLLPAGDADGA